MQTVSSAFVSTCRAALRHVRARVWVKWDGVTWLEETDRLLTHSGSLNCGLPGSDLVPPGDVGSATLVLQNHDARYDPENGYSPLWEHISGPAKLFLKEVRLEQGFLLYGSTEEYVTIFTGVIYDWTPAMSQRTITLQCRDLGFKYLQDRASCPVQAHLRTNELLAYYADLAGVPAGSRIFDVSSFTVPWGWLDDESIIEEAWEVVKADGGRTWWDGRGRWLYHTAQHWAGHTAVDWEIEGPTQGLGRTGREWHDTYHSDELATRITVEWSRRYAGPQQVLYTLDEVKVVQPGATLEFEARLSQPCYLYVEPAAGTYKLLSPGGVDISASCTLSVPVATRYAQRCTVQVTNNHATLSGALIYLELFGYPLIGGPEEQVSVPVPVAPTTARRVRSVRGNMYLQTQLQAEALAHYLAGRYQQLSSVTALRDLPGVPQLELGDRLRWSTFGIRDDMAAPAERDREGFLVGLAWRYGAETGFRQDLTLLDTATLYPYNNYFVIGQTALGTAGRAWY